MHKRHQRKLASILTLNDFEAAARKKLPRPIFGYVYNAAEDRKTYSANRTVFDDYRFVPRAFINVSSISLKTTLFDQEYDAPFGIAPMGISAISAYRGDLVLAEAAACARIPMILSGASLIPMEEVTATGGTDWFQAYLPGTPDAIEALIKRVQRAEFQNLVVTLDYPVPPNPEHNIRSGFSSPLKPSARLAVDGLLKPRWLLDTFCRTLLSHGMPHFENNYAQRGAPIISRHVARDFSGRSHFDWKYLDLVRRLWPGRLVVKGVLHPADAVRAREAGVDGIILSNHGGRQLDGAISPLQVLPRVVAEVPDIPIMIDSGFRRGSDVIKALALGASFVFVGRPFNYAAACAGKAGVEHAVMLLAEEMRRNMALLGATEISSLNRGCLYETSGLATEA